MKRDPKVLYELYGGKHGLNGDYGIEGGYFAKPGNNFGQTDDKSVLEYNCPPEGQPGLWCQWIISKKGFLKWNGGEKFYDYIEWLEYLIEHFFEPWGVKLNGSIRWWGEDRDDVGTITVEENEVTI